MASYIPPHPVDGGNHLALPLRAQNDSEDSFEETAYTSKADDWDLMPDVKAYQQQNEADHLQGRKLGVTWTNLTVKGISADASLNENVLSQFNVPQMFKESRHKQPLKTILEDSHGCVKPGEMLLVVGRPGAGCTTLLKMLSNRRSGFAEVNGKVSFGSLSGKDAERYRGQIVINTEEELFFPTLEVGHTMDFVTKLKVPNQLPTNIKTPGEFQKDYRTFLLKALGIEHTEHTKVGNEYVRGVSGGERKRISIAETIASRASVFCWDNSTRGLDASTALQYTKAIRAMTDIVGLSTIATFYQASNAIYQLFDKVLVLDEGKQIYYGPMDEARLFMEELGFFCDPSANVADYLTGVTVPLERRIREGYDNRFPHTANEIRDFYKNSPVRAAMEQEYGYPDSVEARKNTEEFKLAITSDKNNFLPRSSPLTVGFRAQVKACIVRQSQIIWGDQATFLIKQGATLIQALVVGSLFYKASNDTEGLFYKSGALFFALLYQSLMALSEVTDSFTGRPILAKHKSFAFYDPAAFCIAQLVLDIPILLFQVTQFSVVIYFIVGLKASAAAFFTFWIMIFAVAMCVTAMFRLIGAASTTFDAASKISGFLVSAIIIYIGYFIPKTEMHPWFSWIYWINPLAWGFQSILANEFRADIIQCVGNNLIPSGPSYTDSAFQSCAGVQGAVQGSTLVTGEQYLAALSYSASHIWRNFGVIWALWALFSVLTVVFTRNWKPQVGKGSSLLIPREYTRGAPRAHDNDQEKQSPEKSGFQTPSPNSSTDNIEVQLIKNTSVFTWQNLTYTVKTQSGDRVLLDNVQGWVKPGMLGALMGSSGAGKTTLLDVLAQRKTDGKIQGSVLVDGRDLSVSFQRSAGYCEQLDVHEPLATVREALEFSALLRQSRSVSREEKIKYVDTIIDLLEMQDIEHTLIGRPGAGLSVEQRKRLTIGVELVSKPRILIFLDEPTSGLDGQAAFNTLRFLKKLAAAGQAVLVTIHQPSAQLFKEFDTLLLLAKGGKTVYFGDIGDDAQTLSSYFARHDAPCPPDTNPAEHMIDVVSGSASQGRDWSQIWLESPECKNVESELDRIVTEAAANEPGTKDDGNEFAMPLWQQTILVTSRMSTSLYRNTEYVNNKIALHIGAALFNGFTFWMIGNTVAGLQLRLFTIFNFIFVAPGVINQLQPLFIDRRDIYEVREKKSKMYSWKAFVTGLIVSEIPYLCICAVFYFACWYFTVGFPSTPSKAGATFFVMLFYEFIYTGIGQFVAAYAPNAVFASLVNPVIITILVSFCGVLVPYQGIQEFWRYWIYYINPFNYLMGSILTFTVFDVEVTCADHEFALFNTPNNQSCRDYLAPYLSSYGAGANLVNPDATSGCRVCQYSRGSDYLATLNLPKYLDGWRDAAIVVIFAISSYVMVYFFMKLRTKATKKAEGN